MILQENAKVKEVVRSISLAKGFELLLALKEPRRWVELEKVAKGDKKSLNQRMNEFIKLRLVKPVLLEDSPKGSKAYVLTDFGRFVLEKLEEIEKYSKQ